MTKAQQRAAEIENNKRIAYAAKVRRLCGQLVGERLHTDPIMAAYDAKKTPEAYAAEVAAREPVGKAVFPLKAVAVQAAGDKARKVIDRVRAELEAAGWDMKVAAPDVRGSSWDHAVKAAQAKRSLFGHMTQEDQEKISAWHAAAPADAEARTAYFRAGRPDWRAMSQRGMDHFVARAETMAADEYDAFICKLVGKVGDVVSAELTGDHVWSHSILTVTKKDGAETFGERWKTQQIWNISVLGNEFPQWPTRLMK